MYILDGEKVEVKFNRYANNNRIAVRLVCEDGSPYATVSVNLPEQPLPCENSFFVDVNNNGEEILEWLTQNGFGYADCWYGTSGFCVYPAFVLKKEIAEGIK